jgi:hypothetical protein
LRVIPGSGSKKLRGKLGAEIFGLGQTGSGKRVEITGRFTSCQGKASLAENVTT